MRFLKILVQTRAARAAPKLFYIIFSERTKNYTLLSKFLWTWEALIHSILISEVKDMESLVLWALRNAPNKKNFDLSS